MHLQVRGPDVRVLGPGNACRNRSSFGPGAHEKFRREMPRHFAMLAIIARALIDGQTRLCLPSCKIKGRNLILRVFRMVSAEILPEPHYPLPLPSPPSFTHLIENTGGVSSSRCKLFDLNRLLVLNSIQTTYVPQIRPNRAELKHLCHPGKGPILTEAATFKIELTTSH